VLAFVVADCLLASIVDVVVAVVAVVVVIVVVVVVVVIVAGLMMVTVSWAHPEGWRQQPMA
jgi:hypothetical protein